MQSKGFLSLLLFLVVVYAYPQNSVDSSINDAPAKFELQIKHNVLQLIAGEVGISAEPVFMRAFGIEVGGGLVFPNSLNKQKNGYVLRAALSVYINLNIDEIWSIFLMSSLEGYYRNSFSENRTWTNYGFGPRRSYNFDSFDQRRSGRVTIGSGIKADRVIVSGFLGYGWSWVESKRVNIRNWTIEEDTGLMQPDPYTRNSRYPDLILGLKVGYTFPL